MSKENAITFLAVAPLVIISFIKPVRGYCKAVGALCDRCGCFLVIRFSVLGFGISEPTMEMMNNPLSSWKANQYLGFTAQEFFTTVFLHPGQIHPAVGFPYILTHDYYPRQIR